MSSFEVAVRTIDVQPHPNADAIEVAQVFGYQAIVKKDQFKTGDRVIYLPEASLVPDKLIEHIGLTGKLAGPKKNRVKAIRLRGLLSQGICIGFDGLQELYSEKELPSTDEGTDWAAFLEVVKWVPEVPVQFAGQQFVPEPDDVEYFGSYTDIENIKRYPNVFQEGEEIVALEKAHGSCTIMSLIHDNLYVTSKGIAKSCRALKENEGNVYWRVIRKYNLENKVRSLKQSLVDGLMQLGANVLFEEFHEITLFGEVLGVQDLKYGATTGDPKFLLFDVRINHRYLNYDQMVAFAVQLDIPTVPCLYRGPSLQEALSFTDGLTTIDGATHIREGVVIRPVEERFSYELSGRTILKSVSGDYLTRKGDNATEFE